MSEKKDGRNGPTIKSFSSTRVLPGNQMDVYKPLDDIEIGCFGDTYCDGFITSVIYDPGADTTTVNSAACSAPKTKVA